MSTVSAQPALLPPVVPPVVAPVVIVAGPTASGKSALALARAAASDGVVINADSMQVYRELEILTARPGPAALAQAPHKLYGVRPAAQPFSVDQWLAMARAAIDQTHGAGRLPVVCGGTGLYLKALTDGLARIPDIPDSFRTEARALHDQLGGPAFRARLGEHDPEMAGRLTDGDGQRLTRAWEVWQATGRSLADWQRGGAALPSAGRFWTILLMPEREALYRACDHRFEAMLEHGAMEEVARLAALALDPSLPAMKALGVPQLLALLAGTTDSEAAIAAAKRETRRYAKRQLTWFRHQIHADQTLFAQYSQSMDAEIFPKIRQFLLTSTP